MFFGGFRTRTYLTAVVKRADGSSEDLGVIFDSRWGWFRRVPIERIRRWYLRHYKGVG